MQLFKSIVSTFFTILDFRRSCAELELRALADEAEYRARVCAVMHRLRQQGVPEHLVKDLERKAYSTGQEPIELPLPANHQQQPARLPPAQPSTPQPTQPQQPQPSNGQPHEGKKKRGRPPRNNQQDPSQKLWS